EARSPAHRRLIFDELFTLELALALRRAGVKEEDGVRLDAPGDLVASFVQSLPFPLTGAQARVIGEIDQDLESAHPMHRLLQGDVGSGKTVVAAYAAMRAVEAGYQAAIMAPTEILAEQHFRGLQPYFTAANILPILLTASLTDKDRQRARRRIALGDAKVVIGTHAVIQKG
ncbi:MAG: DEAD/DEAH box helicase, partial [Ottowia sp.]|nr:DEAD/DEAH box helicase [Ottowia sp.]